MKLLLHTCCAPCSGAIIERLCAEGVKPMLFWSNSNIFTPEENFRRLDVLHNYAANFGVPLVIDEYSHEEWLEFQKHNLPDAPENYPERSERCLNCFKFRLLRAARYGVANGFDTLATSLASSRWKSLEQVEEAGNWACARACGLPAAATSPAGEQAVSRAGAMADAAKSAFLRQSERCPVGQKDAGTPQNAVPESGAKIEFWARNWRKGGLQERRNEIIREQNFYNQNFCGCEFSFAEAQSRLSEAVPQNEDNRSGEQVSPPKGAAASENRELKRNN